MLFMPLCGLGAIFLSSRAFQVVVLAALVFCPTIQAETPGFRDGVGNMDLRLEAWPLVRALNLESLCALYIYIYIYIFIYSIDVYMYICIIYIYICHVGIILLGIWELSRNFHYDSVALLQ